MVAERACRPVGAIEPFVRQSPKFKFSLAAYSYRDLLRGNPAPLTLFDFVTDCARFRLEGTELTSYYFPGDVDAPYLRQLKRHCFQLGLDVSGTAVGNDFGHPPGPRRDQEIDNLKRWIEYAEILGAPVIRVFAGSRHAPQSDQETHDLIVSAMQTCCEFAGQHGVHLALENHGGPTSTADGLMALVRDIESPWFGVNLDTGNFHGPNVYEDLERVAPYALNVQVKVTIAGADGQKQPADFNRLAEILRRVNYRGYVVLEYEEAGDPRTECPRYLDQIRQAFA
jgi:sugar phosphate isomerase/epimerase